MRNLHLLPLPPFRGGSPRKYDAISSARIPHGLVEFSDKPAANGLTDVLLKSFSITPEWKLVLETLNRRKQNLKDRLSQW